MLDSGSKMVLTATYSSVSSLSAGARPSFVLNFSSILLEKVSIPIREPDCTTKEQ